MAGIITITPNPALDFSTHTGKVKAGPKLRCAMPQVDPGGGGVNVSRAIRILGGQSLAVLALGGSNGHRLGYLLDHEGITTCRFELPGETRSSLAVTEDKTGRQYRFVLPGPVWTEALETEFLALIARLLRGDETLVLSGSMPEGVAPGFPGRLNDLGASVQTRLAVDISGPAQRRLVDAPQGVWFLRMDAEEAQILSGDGLEGVSHTGEFARKLVADGVAEIVVIGRGSDGSVLATSSGCWHCRSDVSEIRSKVGAGDSLTGAMVLAFSQGREPAEALISGVAAASAAVMTEATELCRAEDATELGKRAVLTAL